ncbi:hypothetical protein PR350_00010 [Mycobacterium marinum]|nr:hypothetical protein [Mycobacterium marinum]MDC9003105.1 hypothetical protein [Mycobacterium marinum]
MEAKVESLRRSQTAGKVSDGYPPSFLLTLAMAMAKAWSAISPFGPSLKPRHLDRVGTDGDRVYDGVGGGVDHRHRVAAPVGDVDVAGFGAGGADRATPNGPLPTETVAVTL